MGRPGKQHWISIGILTGAIGFLFVKYVVVGLDKWNAMFHREGA